MIMDEYMKGNGLMIGDMEKAMRNTQMQIYIKEVLKEVKLMDMEYIIGKMERFMKVNGKMARNLDKGLGKVIINFVNII